MATEAPRSLDTYAKPALAYPDQVRLMQERGIVVDDPAAAARRLASVSYYRLSAYWFPWIGKLREETARSSDAFVGHFKSRYREYPALPIWMTTELISLGALSRLYRGLVPADKRAIAGPLGLHPKRLQDWLHVLTYVRNVCAHHSRLWNRELAIRTARMAEPEWNPPLLPRQDRMFCVLLMLRHLGRQFDGAPSWQQECSALLEPIAALPRWRGAMGMAADWAHHPGWA